MKSLFSAGVLGTTLLCIDGVFGTKGYGTFRTFEEICMKNGFQVESYPVMTDDGYINQLYRIPGKFTDTSSTSSTEAKPVVLMQHGIESDMNSWIYARPEVAPAFLLAEEGYDVWLGNNRGNRYSLGHVNPAISRSAYWDFYQEDMARQDLPSFIDFILETTGRENLTYVGHSEGTTQFFMGASLDPDYFSEKVNFMVALAPVGTVQNIGIGIAKWAATYTNQLAYLVTNILHLYNLIPPHPIINEAIVLACKIPKLNTACINQAKGKYDVNDPYAKRMGVAHSMGGAGWKTWIYYAQSIRDQAGFNLYDYGSKQNQKIYGNSTVPAVPLEDYNIPTYLVSGTADVLADPTDVAYLTGLLGDNVVKSTIQENWDHMSFLTAQDMSYFTGEVMYLINIYNPPLPELQ